MSTIRRRKSYNDTTLSVRLPAPVLEQFTKLSESHFKTPSEMTRQLIVDYIKNAGVIAVQQVSVQNPNAPQQPRKPSQVFMTPEEEAKYNAEWDY